MRTDEPNAISRDPLRCYYHGIAIYRLPANENGDAGGFYCVLTLANSWRVKATSLAGAKDLVDAFLDAQSA